MTFTRTRTRTHLAPMAIEIVNNTAETKSMECLGYSRDMKLDAKSQGLSVRCAFGDTVYEDGNLDQMNSFIAGYPLMVNHFHFVTSLIYNGWGGKTFYSKEVDHLGRTRMMTHALGNYVDANGYNSQVIQIRKEMILNLMITLGFTGIKAGERLVLVLFPHKQSTERVEASINSLNKQFNANKRRAFLLLS